MTTYNEPREWVETDHETAVTQAVPRSAHEDLPYSDEPVFSEARQRRRFGGINWGADFFGMLVTLAMGVLLSGVAAAGLTTLGVGSGDLTGTTGGSSSALVVAAAALTVLLIASYAGGYVAGRMSRFDGGRQGFGVWLIGLLLAGAAVGLALVFGGQYVDRGHLSTLQSATGITGTTGLVAAIVALLCSLLAAVGGGKVGCRYHRKVDEAGYL